MCFFINRPLFADVPCTERTWFFVERLVKARMFEPRFCGVLYLPDRDMGLGTFQDQGCSTQTVLLLTVVCDQQFKCIRSNTVCLAIFGLM